ncbi:MULTISPECIES: DUF6266 family protein [Niastella]|uniref:Uncharacterized protein n=1 Tax=Niastella soli TaxID=2821487 RepID=A0ABS3YZC8_9BACT|nr:DUF6266 family protein [Niastella soli]MBO9203265.1 hypothetical protein [Niastella soli]
MTLTIKNSSSDITTCNKENIHLAYTQNMATASGNLSALHFVQWEILERLAYILQSFIPFFIESNRNIKNITDVNYAISRNLNSALSIIDREFKIDYSKLLLTHGRLQTGMVALTKAVSGGIEFSWARYGCTGELKTHKAILVVYCETLNECVYNIGSARRCDFKATLEIPQLSGHEVHTWLSFLSDDECEIATSVYTGTCIIP